MKWLKEPEKVTVKFTDQVSVEDWFAQPELQAQYTQLIHNQVFQVAMSLLRRMRLPSGQEAGRTLGQREGVDAVLNWIEELSKPRDQAPPDDLLFED